MIVSMKKFQRIINNIAISIFVETILYEKETILFEALFRTFRTSCDEPVKEKVCCVVYRKDSCVEKIFDYYVECNICDDKWIFLLMSDLEEFYIAVLRGTVLHGSCIKVKNKALLLIGERYSGKTTLTKYLVGEKGGECLNDDCIYIVDKSYVGFGMPLPVRWDGKAGYSDKDFFSKTIDADGVVRALYKPCRIASFYNAIDAVVFPKFNLSESGFVEKMSQFEAFTYIINNVRSYKEMKTMFMDIHGLAENAACYRMEYASSETAFQLLCTEIL